MDKTLSTPDLWAPGLADYSAWQRAAHRPIGTIKLRLYHVRRFAHAVSCGPAEVTLDHVVTHMGNPAWSASYVRSVRTSLRSYFSWAHARGLLTSNPAAEAPQVTVPIGKARPATDAAMSTLATARDPRVRFMARLGDEVGMRCCEIARTHHDDVRGERYSRSLLVHGKGGKERLVPISDALAETILAVDGYLFPGQIDGHLSAGYVSKLLSRGMGEHGTGHRLRHRAGTRWLRTSGGNLRVAQELLGHASVATTQVYTFVDDEQLRRAVLAS